MLDFLDCDIATDYSKIACLDFSSKRIVMLSVDNQGLVELKNSYVFHSFFKFSSFPTKLKFVGSSQIIIGSLAEYSGAYTTSLPYFT